MEKSNRKITLKVIIGYVILATVAVTTIFLVFTEIKNFLNLKREDISDRNKVIAVGNLIANIYENESIARAAIQSGSQAQYNNYIYKNHLLNDDIDSLKTKLVNEHQILLLDSVKQLIAVKFENIGALKRIKEDDISEKSIEKALQKINTIESSVGRLTIHDFAEDPDALTPERKKTIEEYIAIVNKYRPKEQDELKSENRLDSIVIAAREMLKEVKRDALIQKNNLSAKENSLLKSDLNVSKSLRNLLFNLENEILLHSEKLNKERDSALNKSSKILILSTIVGSILIILFSFIILNDFWKSQKYRKELEKANAYTNSLLQSREQLISMVSHDLRTPLSTVTGYTDLLAKISTDSKSKYYIDRISKSSKYMKDLVDDLLEFSKLERGTISIEKIPFLLNPIIDEVMVSVKSVYPDKDIKLNVEYTSNIEKSILGDPFRVRQILYNLVGNAYKFTDSGEIKIETKSFKNAERKQFLQIRVSDTGIGIPLEKQPIIFQEFTQIEGENEKKYDGFGLGLTISKKLANLLDGELSFISEEKKGSTFILTLPVEYSVKPIAKLKPKHINIAAHSHVIVIDDDATLRQLLTDILQDKKLKVTAFETAKKALKAMENLPYDLVITDIQLPKMNGFHFMEILKSSSFYKQQPIIASTGRKDLKGDIYKESGFSDIIFKPYGAKELIATVSKWLPKADLKLEIEPPAAVDIQNFKHFNLAPISSFLNNDIESLKDTLQLFLNETEINIETLKSGVENRDLETIHATSHKMLTMFKQLEIKKVIPSLTYLDKLKDINDSELDSTFKNLLEHTALTVAEMEKFID
ncbi:histidine kinase [Formosa agariphila KMM 3901]|uniref:histidine kinase n=1 Tax=Formosa agariphila (strain DSM 15362 / KCTC 12365 / LMG 23005 / KMM 3901 / M-2Alg 35-1) TaxID=1347342 RepID=T2KJT7_FORAG|nr:ATP-binding protein [Formosa agariphila]CDF79030.1 histidine kinase [Formosa agariphila KMM 3901]